MAEFRFSDIRRLDGGLLLIFRELLRTGNATVTARRLALSQSAISHALGRLRELFNDPLFIRRPHGLEPTRRALELGPRIDALLDLAADTIAGDGGFDPTQSRRRFVIAAPEFLTAQIGAVLLGRFRHEAPEASVMIHFLAHDRALDALRRGEVDLALGRYTEAHHEELALEPLFEDRYCVIARQQHPQLRGQISMQHYLEMPHILAAAPSEGAAGETVPELITSVAIVPHWLTALLLVAASDAIATCPERFAACHAAALKLQVLKAPFEQKPFTVSALRRGRADSGIDWLIEQVAAVA